MLPKRYWKNGSFSNGDAWRRLGSSDEMFVTASTVRAATSVKSGPLGQRPRRGGRELRGVAGQGGRRGGRLRERGASRSQTARRREPGYEPDADEQQAVKDLSGHVS